MKMANGFLSLALAALVATSTLGGCARKTATASSSASAATATTPVEISISLPGTVDALKGGSSDKMLQDVQQKIGVKLSLRNITWEDYTQKYTLWAASGTLPDIISSDFLGFPTFTQWVNQDIIRALPDDLSPYPYLSKYLNNMKRATDAKVNGKFYAIPHQSYPDISYSVLDRCVYYRWDLAQKVGITKEPTTYDEFREMILKIIKADPEGKHIAGMTGEPSNIAGFIWPYGGCITAKWVLDTKDNKWKPGYFAGDMKAAMQLGRDMYTEGTIEKGYAVNNYDTGDSKFLEGKNAAYAVSGGVGRMASMESDWKKLYGHDIWQDVKMCKLYPCYDGKKYYFFNTEAYSECYINAKVDDQKMAVIMKLFNYLLEPDELVRINYGYEGEDWKYDTSGKMVKITQDLGKKYPFATLGLASWGMAPMGDISKYPTGNPKQIDAISNARVEDAQKNGTRPVYSDAVEFLATPLQSKFERTPTNDMTSVVIGTQSVTKMISDLMAKYESKYHYSEMITQVNAAADKAGIPKS